MLRGNLDFDVNSLITQLNRFGDHLKNVAIRAGAVAAGKPLQQKMTQLVSRFVGKGEALITIKGVKVPRLRLSQSIIVKVWRIPDGSGYVTYTGPVSVQVPHAHWFGDRAPANRYTKAGKYTGTHLSHKGGPARVFSRTEQEAGQAGLDAALNTIGKKLEEFQGA